MKIDRLFDSQIACSLTIAGLLLLSVNCYSLGSESHSGVVGEGKENHMANFQKKDANPKPDPKLSPEEVIGIQLEALQHNDKPTKDSGIAKTFEFASPGNKESTGPLERFIEMVKNPAYRPMLNHRRAERAPIKVSGDVAQQKVTLTSAEGERVVYVFILSKQKDGPYKDCWMTDGVVRAPDEQQERERIIVKSNGHLRSYGQA